jgi:hypothetical protein
LKSKLSRKPAEAGSKLNPEDYTVHSHCYENLKSNCVYLLFLNDLTVVRRNMLELFKKLIFPYKNGT